MNRRKIKIAVLGSGNGGCAVAFDWAQQGHEVRIFDFKEFDEQIRKIKGYGGIYAEGELEGFAPVQASHDIGKTLDKVDIVFIVGPSYSNNLFARAYKPHLQKGQKVIICPGSCAGSIEFKKEIGLDFQNERIEIAETSTLPYCVRLIEPAKLHFFLKLRGGLFIAALPARLTPNFLPEIKLVYPNILPAKNILHTSLQNGNPVIHPAISLLNAALIERTKGNFLFYEEGVTRAVGRLIREIDRERIAIGHQLGLEIIPEPELGYMQGYMSEKTYDTGYSTAPGFRGVKAQPCLDDRYFNEDVGYGLVFLKELAEQVGVDTPCISALVKIISIIMDFNYIKEAKRTMKMLGLSKYNLQKLLEIIA